VPGLDAGVRQRQREACLVGAGSTGDAERCRNPRRRPPGRLDGRDGLVVELAGGASSQGLTVVVRDAAQHGRPDARLGEQFPIQQTTDAG
jgi:hypothetical protein